MVFQFFNFKTNKIFTAAGILAISSLISHVLGLAREYLLADTFGAGLELDVYLAAFRIPDLVYNVLIAGGILVAFLPLFSEYFSRNEKEAWQFTSNCLNIFLFFLIILCSILFLFSPSLVKLIAPGFNSQQINSAIILTRLMFLSPIFFGLSSIFSGILQYFDRFLIYSLCPILYNLGIIFGILFLTPFLGVLGVAIGVVIGAFFHFTVQIPSAIGCGFSYKLFFNFKDWRIKKVFTLMIPRTFAMAANQINLIVITAIASTLTPGSISIFNFANNIQSLPIGIIGISFATAAFPALSKSFAQNQKDKFRENFSLVFRQILYFVISISILIFIFRDQIVEIILRHGQFSLTSAKLTSASLGLFSLSIFAASLIPLIFRALFSLQDTKTPTIISIISVGFNIVLSFFLTHLLKSSNIFQILLKSAFSLQGIEDISVLGLPLAISIATIFQFILLSFFLKKKMRIIFDDSLKKD